MNGETPAPSRSGGQGHGLNICGRGELTYLSGSDAVAPPGVVCLTQWHGHTSAAPGVDGTRWTCTGAGIK